MGAARRRRVLQRSLLQADPTGSAARRSRIRRQSISSPPDRKTLTRVIDDLNKPNGIIGTADGKTLYVADIGGNKTFAYDIQPDGSLEKKRLFCELGSDGMTLDDQGNVYLTGKGVTVFDKTGKQIEHIAVPEGWSANVCFGGEDMKTLFITASKGLYGMKMKVKGGGSSSSTECSPTALAWSSVFGVQSKLLIQKPLHCSGAFRLSRKHIRSEETTMTRVAILPVQTGKGEISFRAVAG